VLFKLGDFEGPGAFGVGIRLSGGVTTLDFGEALDDVVEAVLQGGAAHKRSVSLWKTSSPCFHRCQNGQHLFDGIKDMGRFSVGYSRGIKAEGRARRSECA